MIKVDIPFICMYFHIPDDITLKIFIYKQICDNNEIFIAPYIHICHATGIEEDPKATQDIRCLRRGGGAALIQTKQQFPQPKR